VHENNTLPCEYAISYFFLPILQTVQINNWSATYTENPCELQTLNEVRPSWVWNSIAISVLPQKSTMIGRLSNFLAFPSALIPLVADRICQLPEIPENRSIKFHPTYFSLDFDIFASDGCTALARICFCTYSFHHITSVNIIPFSITPSLNFPLFPHIVMFQYPLRDHRAKTIPRCSYY
jgi:hypothetical protein